MERKSPESGLDELLRLSRATAKMEKDLAQKEQQEAQQRQKVQGAVQGLREISISVALEQLKPVATTEVLEEVRSLAHKNGTEDLRKLITNLTSDLEKRVSRVSATNPEMALVESSVKTLAILLSLFFSLK
jgi:hypothetical protein